MKGLPVYRKNLNLEILSKIMNSVAVKYDCSIKYSSSDEAVHFHGDTDCKRHIAEDTIALFNDK
ncbi:MAG: hypothetical protein GY874_20925 [Desulfobacteraceae bacterium]|nr:hypothetical protein [Desulfobacteraceae bacterium]